VAAAALLTNGCMAWGAARSQPANVPTPANKNPAQSRDSSVWSLEGKDGAKVTHAAVRIRSAAPLATGCPTFAMGKLSPMLRRIDGVVAVLDTRGVRALAAMTPRPSQKSLRPVSAFSEKHAENLYSFSLCDQGKGESVRRVDVLMSADGSIWAKPQPEVAPGDEPPRIDDVQALDRDKFLAMVEADGPAAGEAGWSWYGGAFAESKSVESADRAASKVLELPQPYIAGRHIFDRETIGKRLLGGAASKLDRADRVLALEKLHVRTPVRYSPREPSGLLVWIDADDECHLPEAFFDAFDSANIVVAGFDKCGNSRPVANRYQLALDAVATVSRRFHIDRRRVYIAGISGGGRVASILQGCFPDIFAGAIPIVGMSCFDRVPTARGRHVPAAYARPHGRLMDLLRRRRIAPITGAKDFNHAEIGAAAQIMRGEGLLVTVFETQEQGHDLPKPALFAQALKWVDEPWSKMRKAETDLGEREWEIKGRTIAAKPRKPIGDEDRATLVRITAIAPWTPGAWKAVELLETSR